MTSAIMFSFSTRNYITPRMIFYVYGWRKYSSSILNYKLNVARLLQLFLVTTAILQITITHASVCVSPTQINERTLEPGQRIYTSPCLMPCASMCIVLHATVLARRAIQCSADTYTPSIVCGESPWTAAGWRTPACTRAGSQRGSR